MNENQDRSSRVCSSQIGLHADLHALVEKHLKHPWQQPVHAGSRAAFASVFDWLDPEKPLMIDSGCGTGQSVQVLAESHPDAQVLGLDQSEARLARAPRMPANARLVRARCEDAWRLLKAAGISIHKQFLLYPNPWPKPGHVLRRWHAHPAFPDLLGLGGHLEVRSNWKLYLDEFQVALEMCGFSSSPVVLFEPDSPLTLFERKYARSGHNLYRLNVELS